MSSRAEVFCRVRPTDKMCLQQFHFNPSNTTVQVTRRANRSSSNAGKGANDQEVVHTFTFDNIFAGSNATQESIFRATAMKLVQKGLLEGINGTLLCHGQRDSGKTYTMFGGNDFRSRGLAARAITQVYEDIQRFSLERTYTVMVSFLQFYGGEVTDLLTGMSSTGGKVGNNPRCGSRGSGSSSGRSKTPSSRLGQSRHRSGSAIDGGNGPLSSANHPSASPGGRNAPPSGEGCLPQVTLDGKGEVLLKGIEKRVCASEEEALSTVFEGLHNRSTNKNVHVVLSLYARHQSLVDSECETREAVLHLVDLAGIQRGDGLTAEQRREVQVVNRSLSMLEQVILCLGNPQTNSSGEVVKGHIPYRQSKLTTLLKDCMGGSSFTTLIAHIYPEQQFLDASISTLNFARRMMHLVTEPTVNVVQDANTQIRNLQRQVGDLKAELRMQNQLSLARAARQSSGTHSGDNSTTGEGGSHQKGGGGGSNVNSPTPTYGTDELQSIHEKVQTYLNGGSNTIYVNDVREMNACFAYFRQLLEQKDLYITEIQSEVYSSKAQNSFQRDRGSGHGGNKGDGEGFFTMHGSMVGASAFSSPTTGLGFDSMGGRSSFASGNKGGTGANGAAANAGKGLGGAHRRRAPSSNIHTTPSTTNLGASVRLYGKEGAGSGGSAGAANPGDLHTPSVLDKHGGVSYGVAGKAAQVTQRLPLANTIPPSSERDRMMAFGNGGNTITNILPSMAPNVSMRGVGQTGGPVGGNEAGGTGPSCTTSYATVNSMPGTTGSPAANTTGGQSSEPSNHRANLTIHTYSGMGANLHQGGIASSSSSAGYAPFSSQPESRPPGVMAPSTEISSRPGQGGVGVPSCPPLLTFTPPSSGPLSYENYAAAVPAATSSALKPSASLGGSNSPHGSTVMGASSLGSRVPVPPLPLPSQSGSLRGDVSKAGSGTGTTDHVKARAFEDYKKNSNGALQIRALAEDQEQLAQIERRLSGLFRRLEKIEQASHDKAQRRQSQSHTSAPSTALLSHLAPHGGGGGGGRGSRPHSSGGGRSGFQASDEDDDPYRMTTLQLSVFYSATEENIKTLTAERSHLIKQMERRQKAFLTNFSEWYARISGDTSELTYEFGGAPDSAVGKQLPRVPGLSTGQQNNSSTVAYPAVTVGVGQTGSGNNSGRSGARRGLPQASFLDGSTTSSPGIRAGGVGGGVDPSLPPLAALGGMMLGNGAEAAGPLFYQLQDDRFLDAAERFDAMEMQRRTAQDPQSGAFYAAKKFVESKNRDQGRVNNRA